MVAALMKRIYCVTGNKHKADEIIEILREYGVEARHIDVDLTEIQSESLEEVASACAVEASNKVGEEVIVEDSGLFINSLNGFPGPYSSYVYKTLGCGSLLKLMHSVAGRKAVFRSVVAYCRQGGSPKTFVGEAYGEIAYEEKGTLWGFDPIFIPEGGGGQTYAEMSRGEKNRISHRRKALENFAHWFLDR